MIFNLAFIQVLQTGLKVETDFIPMGGDRPQGGNKPQGKDRPQGGSSYRPPGRENISALSVSTDLNVLVACCTYIRPL